MDKLTLVITGLLFRNTESFHDLIVASSTYQEIYPTYETLLCRQFIPTTGAEAQIFSKPLVTHLQQRSCMYLHRQTEPQRGLTRVVPQSARFMW